MNQRNALQLDLVSNYYFPLNGADSFQIRQMRKAWLSRLQESDVLLLHQQSLERLNNTITELEYNRAFHANAARELYEQFKATIESKFQKYQFSKLDDYDLAEAMRKTHVLLTTPVLLPNQNINPKYLSAHANFTESMIDMKSTGRYAAIATAGMALAVAAAVAFTVVLNLCTFGVFGTAAVSAVLITLNVSTTVTQLVIGINSAFRAFGQFNIARHSLGMGDKMDKLAQETQLPRKH